MRLSIAVAGMLLWQSAVLMGGDGGAMLGCARPFAVLGARGISNTGWSILYGEVGAESGGEVAGFPPGAVFGGAIHRGDPVVVEAAVAAAAAYKRLMHMPSFPIASATEGNLGGLKLPPGVYTVDGSARLNGVLRLDAGGRDHAVFVFQIASKLTTARGAAVVMTHGGVGEQVYWQVGDSARLGEDTSFEGSILAHNDVAIATGAKIRCGRAVSLTGKVRLDSASVSTACESAELPLPGLASVGAWGVMPNDSTVHTTEPVTVNGAPEPATFWLAATGIAGWGLLRFRRAHRPTAMQAKDGQSYRT